MAKSITPWVIEKMQPTLTLLVKLVDLGKDVIRRLFPPTLDLNPIQKVIIHYLNHPIKFIPHSSIET